MIRTAPQPSHSSHGPHSYLASVSDLVSALIFVFIIMLAVFAYQLASVTESLATAEETRERILHDIQLRLTKFGMSVQVVPEQGVLRLSDHAINFPSGSDSPNLEHHSNVGLLARAIAEVVPCYVASTGQVQQHSVESASSSPTHGVDETSPPGYCDVTADPQQYECHELNTRWRLETLLIEGHTDHIPVAPGNRFRNNIELSSMRAATVHQMITNCEPSVVSMFNSHGYRVLSVSGYGATRPVTLDLARVRENRRIDLRFLMDPPDPADQPDLDIEEELQEHLAGDAP